MTPGKQDNMVTTLELPAVAPGTLTEKQHEVYEAIRKAGGIDNQALAKALKTTPTNIAQHVRKMRLRGVLPEAAAGSNGGQRSTRRAAATPPPPPAPEPTPEADEPTPDPTEGLVEGVDAEAKAFLLSAEARHQEIQVSLAAIERQRAVLEEAAKHLERQIKGLGGALQE